MYNLKLPNSQTALRLGAEFLTKLAEQAETIRAECGTERIVAQRVGDVARVLCETTHAQPEPQQLEVATPASETNESLEPAGAAIPQPTPTAAPEVAPVAEALASSGAAAVAPVPPAPPAPPAAEPEPELLYHPDRSGGHSLEAMRLAGWTDDKLIEAGYAEWVVPAPKPPAATAAPGASAGSAPVPPAAPAPADPATSLDKDGLPWDERIHSSSKAVNQTDGLWRKKRGVSDELVVQVEAELRALMGNAPAPGAGEQTAASAPIAPASAPVPPAALAPATGTPTTFAEMTQWLLAQTKLGKLSPTDVQLAIMGCGVEGVNMLPHLSGRPDLIPNVYAKLAEKVGA